MTTGDFFSLFDNACLVTAGFDGRGLADRGGQYAPALGGLELSTSSGRRHLCARLAFKPVLNIMIGLSGKLSQAGTIGVSLGQLQRCMRNGKAAASWRLAR